MEAKRLDQTMEKLDRCQALAHGLESAVQRLRVMDSDHSEKLCSLLVAELDDLFGLLQQEVDAAVAAGEGA